MLKLTSINKLLIIVFLMNAVPGFSQRGVDKGDRYFNVNQFDAAIRYYLTDIASKNRKTSEYAMQKLADCYRITGEFEKAEEWYRKILKKRKKDPVNYLNYGLSLKNSAKYAEAKIQFEEYIKLKPEDLMGPVYLHSCDSAQKWLDETMGKEVKNIEKVNTPYSEFSPYIIHNKVYFSSSRPGSKQALISFDGGGEVHRLDIYSIDFNSIDKKVTDASDITNFKEINSPRHEGAACFSKDGKELYFTKTVKGSRNETTNAVLNTLQIFYSKIDSSGKWSVPVSAFSFNSTNYSVGHPSLSADGNTIFFMSDMKGGFGKTDIYYCSKQSNGKWAPPRNIGNSINTFGHEMFPFISESGVLYFSSNAHPGMGQLDIFEAHYMDGKWTGVVNVKPPVNSIGNDFGMVLDGGMHRGFFSSDRFNGKGAEDIYSFAEELPLTLNFKDDTLLFFDKSVFDELKYKIINEKDKSETALISVNGVYKFKLDKTTPYKLVARKSGMVYNTLFFVYNSAENNYSLKIKTTAKPILLEGLFNLSKKGLFNETVVMLTDTSGSSRSYSLRSFSPVCDTAKINFEYYITTKVNSANRNSGDALPVDVPVHLKLKIISNNEPLDKAVILIKDGEEAITTTNSSNNGEVSFFLKNIYPGKYTIEVSSPEHHTKNVELFLKRDSSQEEIEVILDKK